LADDAAAATPFSGITYDDAQKTKFWSGLSFSHNSSGMTPYQAVVDAALALLTDNPSDTRPKEVILITDGLPTDDSPKAVMTAAAALVSQNIRVTTMYIFKPSRQTHVPSVFGPRQATLQRIETTRAYTSLETSFADGWGRTDGFTRFVDYWGALSAIPKVKAAGGISTFYVPLAVDELSLQVVQLVGKIAYCTVKK
jgi:hypothetical protein